MTKGRVAIIIIATLVVVIGAVIFFNATPVGRQIMIDWGWSLQKVDESSYENLKQVEDTARAMIAQYKTDKLTYEQYVGNENEEKASWAEEAKMRANSTAIKYNEYILKNSYVWEDNIPSDIDYQLETIE